ARGERSAERRYGLHLHLAVPRAVVPARAPPGAPLRRFWARSPCFVAGPEDHILTLSRQRLRPAFHPSESQPFKAAPSSGADDDRASWDGVTSPACRRRTLLRQIDVSR